LTKGCKKAFDLPFSNAGADARGYWIISEKIYYMGAAVARYGKLSCDVSKELKPQDKNQGATNSF
jgi:hypothetical protein